jgi:hypothetical protein
VICSVIYSRVGTMDDDKIREIIESLPEKRSRSRLEPYRQLIAELRRLRRTYREIAHVLAEKCQVPVSAAAVHNFVRLHLRRNPNPIRRPQAGIRSDLDGTPAKTGPVNSRFLQEVTISSAGDEEIRRRIEELKRRPVPVESAVPLFHYDPNEPLHLLPKNERRGSGVLAPV